MKKWIASLLALALFAGILSGCSKKEQPPIETKPQETTLGTDPTVNATLPSETPREILDNAAQKLDAAKSFELSSQWEYQQNGKTLVVKETEEKGWGGTVLYSMDENGVITSLSKDVPYGGGGTVDTTSDFTYLKGNVGYEYNTYYNYGQAIKHISDKPFGDDMHFADWNGTRNVWEDIVEAFCKLNPTMSLDKNGWVILKVDNITLEQWNTVIPDDCKIEAESAEYFKNAKFSIEFAVDQSGFVRRYIRGTHNVAPEAYFWKPAESGISGNLDSIDTWTYDRIGEDLHIQEPELATNFATKSERAVYDHIAEGCYAEYRHHEYFFLTFTQEMVEDMNAFVFEGVQIQNFRYQDMVVPVYEVKVEIDGLPVKFVNCLAAFCKVEKVVIPQNTTVHLNTGLLGENPYGDTELFFKAEEGETARYFYTVGETEKERPMVKAAYYVGQWEYVDDIPTGTVSYSEGLAYTLLKDGKSYALSGMGTCKDTHIAIPNFYNGLPVTQIGYSDEMGNHGLGDCPQVVSMSIPSSVKRIDFYAFWGCTNLKELYIPDGVSFSGDEFAPITQVKVGKNNRNYKNDSAGALYSVYNKGMSLMHLPSTYSGEYRIEEGTTVVDARISEAIFGEMGPNELVSNVTSLHIPASVTRIEACEFLCDDHIETITFGGTVAQWNAIKLDFYFGVIEVERDVICTDGTVHIAQYW